MRDARVFTLTMNPALDLSTEVEAVVPFSKLHCGPLTRDPGGGGINVARMIRRLGGNATAVFPAGGPAGQVLIKLLEAEEADVCPIAIAGETREDFAVFERKTSKQYRFIAQGADLSESEWRSCLDHFVELARDAEFAVVSGSLPRNVSTTFFVEVARRLSQLGVKFALDTSGAGLRAALSERIALIKPNLHEFADLTGEKHSDVRALVQVARALISKSRIGAIALSLAADGAILASREGAWRARPPQVQAASTVGAGDSFMGGLVLSLAKGKPWPKALQAAVASGTAALLAAGTGLARPTDIDRLLPEVSIEEIA